MKKQRGDAVLDTHLSVRERKLVDRALASARAADQKIARLEQQLALAVAALEKAHAMLYKRYFYAADAGDGYMEDYNDDEVIDADNEVVSALAAIKESK